MSEQPLWPSFTPTYHHEQYPSIDPSQPALDCSGKYIFVTGGGRGIGRAIALAFARAHAAGIALLGRTQATLDETAELIKTASNGRTDVFVVIADIMWQPQVVSAMASTIAHFGGHVPDILVNNAGGLHGVGSVTDVDVDDFWRAYELNVKGPLIVTQCFLRANQQHSPKVARTIINISSGGAHLPFAQSMAAYSTSKLALAKALEYVHHENPAWNVFNVQPGRVATDLAKQHAGGKVPKAPDVAELPAGFCVWLATNPAAKSLNGRFLWANWDVDELVSMKEDIEARDLLTLTSKGWAGDATVEELKRRAQGLYGDGKK